MKKSPTRYSWADINKMTEGELRKAYKSTSREAREAYKQMNDAYPNLAELKTHRGDFKTLGDLGDINKYELGQELMMAQNYLKSDYADVEKYRASKSKALETLKQSGYENVNEENYEQFTNYMANLRDKGLISQLTSSYIAELFGQFDNKKVISRVARAQREGVSEDVILANLEYWSENAENLERLYFSKKRGTGSGRYK